VKVAWDEWNMFGWVFDGVEKDETYTLEDAVVTASIMNSFIRNAETVCMANYSTFVNINGALSTKEDGTSLKRAQYPVFCLYGNHTGDELVTSETESETFELLLPHDYRALAKQRPGRPSEAKTTIPYLDCVVSASEDGNKLYLHIVNKNETKAYETAISLMECEGYESAVHYEIYHENLNAANTVGDEQVKVCKKELKLSGTELNVSFREHSVNVIEISR